MAFVTATSSRKNIKQIRAFYGDAGVRDGVGAALRRPYAP
jgi:hypothetical protein